MRRTSGALIGAAIAVAAGGLVAFGSTQLAAHRASEQTTYGAALHGVRREAAQALPIRATPVSADLCVRGPEGLAVAAARALGASVRASDGSLDGAALALVSRAAFAAARDREDATGAPALPQRMGLVDGAPLAPHQTCAGELAWARASVMGVAPAAVAQTPAGADASKASGSKKSGSKKSGSKKSARSKPAKPAH
jgi:hypothetical protein